MPVVRCATLLAKPDTHDPNTSLACTPSDTSSIVLPNGTSMLTTLFVNAPSSLRFSTISSNPTIDTDGLTELIFYDVDALMHPALLCVLCFLHCFQMIVHHTLSHAYHFVLVIVCYLPFHLILLLVCFNYHH